MPWLPSGASSRKARGRQVSNRSPVRVTITASRRVCAERLVHDAPDGAGASPALRAASEAAVDLAGGARRSGGGRYGANLMIAQHVAGADDHGDGSRYAWL